MKIYNYEINDGISDAINDKNSIAFECHILEDNKFIPDVEQTNQSFAFVGTEKQKDLYYLNSVLVSAGWNKNDDVFGVMDLWDARHTPVNKQFNYMHDDSDIIGHMISSMVMDQDGNEINDQSAYEDLPEKIDIITSAVIYKMWSDPSMRERIDELTKEIDAGKWSVSMECIFSDFDYAIVGPDGSQRVLSRTEESAFLTKHLRAYGGTGDFNGYKIGRLLKGFYFSGKGLVAKPANPRSIIFSKDLDPFNTKANDISINNFLTAMEIHNMNEETKQIEDLKAELESVKAGFEAEKSAIEQENKQRIEELENAIADLLSEKIQLQQDAEVSAASLGNKDKEITDLVKQMRDMKRTASLCGVGLDKEAAGEIVKNFTEASDDMFESIITLAANSTKPVSEVVVESPTVQASPIDFGSDEEDEEGEEADASELERVEEVAEATLANPESEDENQNIAIASAATWLRASVLKSTKKLNK